MEHATKANIEAELPVSKYNGRYQKSAYENLIDINNNLSCMLKESFAEIDSICHRVRTCLLDANSHSKPPNLMVLDTTITTCESVCLCRKLDATNDYQHGDGNDSILTEIVEENGQRDGILGEIFEEQSETEPDTTETSVELAEINELTPTSSRLPLPFITILNQNRSVQSVGIKVSPKKKLSTHCRTDNFQKIMEEVENLSNYEQLLMSMVDEINQEINTSYAEYDKGKVQVKNQRKKSHKQNKELVHKIKASKALTDQTKDDTVVEIATTHVDQAIKPLKDWIEDQFSDNDLHELYSIKGDKKGTSAIEKEMMKSTSPDVYRKRAITDLHQRLVAQIEANDSLMFFQKIMAKSRKREDKCELRTSSTDTVNLPEKKALRSPIEHIIKRKNGESERKQRSIIDLSKKYHDSLWFRQKRHETRKRKKSRSNENKRKTKPTNRKCYGVNSAQSISIKAASRKQSRISVCNYKVEVTNEQPLSEPVKCKLNFMRTKYFQMTNRKLKHLDILDDITQNDVMPIKSEYPRRDEIKTKTNIKNSYLYKLMYGTKSILENAWLQFFEPKIKCSTRNCSRCSRTRASPLESESDEDSKGNQLQEQSTDRGQVIRKLSKYIFSETEHIIGRDNIYTIMPVHVFYDHYRPSLSKEEFHPKLPLVPMKECKENIKKGEWRDNGRKAKPVKVVYDPILRKIDREIKINTARQTNKLDKARSGQTSSWSPKNFSKYCTSPNSQHSPAPKKETQLRTSHRIKESNSPGLGGPSKRSPKTIPSPTPIDRFHPLVPPLWMNYHDALIKKSDASTKSKRSKQKEDQHRKIWENKYAKTVGHKLINFIEKQPEVYKLSVPKYALPKTCNESRRKLMIKQLFDLKQKNDSIQTNIQKAIEVIEKKMIDIISKPSASNSMDAFDEMEKEIMAVLNMMKCSQRKGTPTKNWGTLGKLEENNEEIDKISDELFKRLDKILDSSELSSISTSSKKMSKKQNEVSNRDSVGSRSKDMKQICFSSTSASGEEKFVITAISPNKRPKKVSPVTIQSISIPLDLRKLDDLHENQCVSKSNVMCDITKFDLTKTDNKNQPLETIVNLALVETMVQQDDLIKEHSSGSTKSSDNAEMSSQEDRFSHGDFDNNQSFTKDDINTDAVAIPTDDKEAHYQQLANSSDSSINILSNNTDTIYFTPQCSPLRKLRSEETTIKILEEDGEADVQKPETNILTKNEIEKVDEDYESVKKIDEEPNDDEANKRIEVKKSEGLDVFYENVNRIIRRVEDVYSQLDEFEQEILGEEIHLDLETKHTPPNLKIESNNEVQQDFLVSPSTFEVKEEDDTHFVERVATPRSISTGRSPSYYNVLSFLDSLGDFQEDRPVEIYNYRICPTLFVVEMSLTFSFSALFNFASVQPVIDLPKKRSGCLKKSSFHSNISPTKSKQKVSFLLQKLHKETQVRSCPFHNARWNQPEFHNKTNISAVVRVDQEVTATLDTKVTRSVDKMSSADESYESTLETSDELSMRMMSVGPETVLLQNPPDAPNDSKNNVVEIFRSHQKLESNGTNTIKVFYDNYQKKADSDLKEIGGSFNEASIEEVKRSLSTTVEIKKRDSVQKLTKDIDPDNFVSEIIKEVPLLEPLKNLNQFVDSTLLKEVIEKRQRMRMLRRKNSNYFTATNDDAQDECAKDSVVMKGEKEGLLKGIYVFVYILMFTALNLEFKCV